MFLEAFEGNPLLNPQKNNGALLLENLNMNQSKEASPFQDALENGVFADASKILLMRGDLKGKLVLDLACGDGRTTYLLRKMGAIVSPFDIIPEYYKLDDRARFADVQQRLPIPDESADLVILQEVIEHLPNQLFALQEIYRVLKPGGELFITTPSRSSLEARLSYLFFESENLKACPWGSVDGIWGRDTAGNGKYYGHLWLIGMQQLKALGGIAGFKSIEIKRTKISKASVVLMFIFYPFIFLVSIRALYRDMKKHGDNLDYRTKYLKE
ncbi:MAG: class I SAM-dependent methyltransferase, partial [Betaproteobacteria bacterium]|nr:class I SAM-dependent methyltransferase [Betaproteobacteria bacterium]